MVLALKRLKIHFQISLCVNKIHAVNISQYKIYDFLALRCINVNQIPTYQCVHAHFGVFRFQHAQSNGILSKLWFHVKFKFFLSLSMSRTLFIDIFNLPRVSSFIYVYIVKEKWEQNWLKVIFAFKNFLFKNMHRTSHHTQSFQNE